MKILAIARMTFSEVVRQPAGLLMAVFLSIFMFLAAPVSVFNLDAGTGMLRVNNLSTILVGGVVYVSIVSTSLFHRELSEKTILSILTRPVGLPAYYAGKWLGILASLLLFFLQLLTTGLLVTVMGTVDTVATRTNPLPLVAVFGGLFLLALLAAAMSYMAGASLVGFMSIGWGVACPVMLGAVVLASRLMGYPLPTIHEALEFGKAGLLVLLALLIPGSFAIALSTVTGPVANLALSISFVLLGLLSPGLCSALAGACPQWAWAGSLLPDFHPFWAADLVNLGGTIPTSHILACLLYALPLAGAFTLAGIYALCLRDIR